MAKVATAKRQTGWRLPAALVDAIRIQAVRENRDAGVVVADAVRLYLRKKREERRKAHETLQGATA